MRHLSTLLAYAALCSTVVLSEDALHYLDKHVSDYNTELIELVNIPSISSLPEHRDDMLSAATWLQMRLKQAGLEASPFKFGCSALMRIKSRLSLSSACLDKGCNGEHAPDRLCLCPQEVRSIPTKQQPIVFGQWLHAKGLPTVLIYGHYDVQPVDPLELWHTQPFDTQLVDGEFLGRGVNDDKGGLLQPIQAIEALLQSEGKLPVNVKVRRYNGT